MKLQYLNKKLYIFILVILVIINGILFLVWLQGINADGDEHYAEIQELDGNRMSFQELSQYFRVLAQEKGAGYAFGVLKEAHIIPGIDLHLLAHTVGSILYNQQGVEGIKICTHDFRNACSHSIVIGLFLEEGDDALSQIADACRQAPGGRGAYGMCFHGLGHGVLAYTQYEMPEAVALCKKTGTLAYNNQEYKECVGGVVMEMMAGVHDREVWLEKSSRYFKTEDPLYPCTSDFIPSEVQEMCYTYLTPHLFEAASVDLANPGADGIFKKAFSFCSSISDGEDGNQYACYASFGKEFVVLAKERDIRNVSDMRDDQLENIYNRCQLADDKEGIEACISSATTSLYWGGENDRDVAVRFCNQITDLRYQRSCTLNLIGNVSYYIQDPVYRREFCEELIEEYREDCREFLF